MAKAKGTTMIGAVRFLRSRREEAEKLMAPELNHYLHERIRESSWYAEEDLLGLLEVLVQMMPGPREEALASMGALSAREHLEGVYAHLNTTNQSSHSSRSFALWASQHDTGTFKSERLRDGSLEMSVRDFGLPSEIMCGIFAGYFAETLRIEGVTGIRTTKQECVLRGDPQCCWRLEHD